MTMTITESGMNFGPYPKDVVFHIEQSKTYKTIQGLKVAEFIILDTAKKQLKIIEAKSSSPKPDKDNVNDFDSYLNDIAEKMSNTLSLWFAIKMKRHANWYDEMPKAHQDASYELPFKLILVINGHKIEWLVPIKDELDKKLKRYTKIWNLSSNPVLVLNDELAREHHLIV